jgi:diketogulonate reductase-like aldo/keto reductase
MNIKITYTYCFYLTLLVKFFHSFMEELYEQGKVKAIGVCNFNIHHLEKLMAQSSIKPMVNQIEALIS